MLEKIKHYTYRTKEAIEQVLLEDRAKSLNREEVFNELLRGSNKQEKFIGLLRLIKSALPEKLVNIDRDKLEKLLRYGRELPFSSDKYKLRERIGRGGECQVYLLQSQLKENPSWALKVAIPDRNRQWDISERLEFIKEYHKRVVELYKDIPELIPPEYSLIISDPSHRKIPAIATLQPFISGEIKDIFKYTPEELIDLANRDKSLGEQLKSFCNRTIDNFEKTGEVLDMLGLENVSVIENENQGKRLIVLDSHFIHDFSKQPIETQRRINNRIGFLKQTANLLNDSK